MLRLTTHKLTEVRSGFEIEAVDLKEQNKAAPLQSIGHAQVQDLSTLPSGYSSSRGRHFFPDASNGGFSAGDITTKAVLPTSNDGQTPTQDDINFISDHRDHPQTVPSHESSNDNSNDNDVDPKANHANVDREAQAKRDSVIYHLIVTVKAPHTVNAVRAYAHRLTPQSTVLFVQNGMGVIDEINKEVFPSETDRPHYMVGVLSHGLHGKDPFDVVYAGDGTLALGLLAEKEQYPASARYLLRTVTRTPVFVAMGLNPTELLQQQLDKLAVNAVINPLTALLDCLNSELLNSFYVTRVMRLLLAEVSLVFRSLPELQNVLNVNMRFDSARLESMVVRVAKLTGQNRSSMLQDLKAGRETEIDYINGYVVRRGEELGIHCVTNYAIMQMVKAKKKLVQLELEGTVPLHPSIKP